MDKKKVVLIVLILIVYTVAVAASSIAIYQSQVKKESEKKVEELMDKAKDSYAQNTILNQIQKEDENETNIDTSSPDGWKNIMPDSFVNSTNGFMDSILNK